MIGKLTGTINEVRETHLIIDVNGVGYAVYCSRSVLQHATPGPEVVPLWIETLFKNEQLVLYGFKSYAEQQLFNLLTKVQGVGSRMGLAILSALSPQDIISSITLEDATRLTQADGVGPKLAQRITRELKGKAGALASFSVGESAPASDAAPTSAMEDVISALLNLGYRRPEITQALRKVPADARDSLSIDALIPLVLKELSR